MTPEDRLIQRFIGTFGEPRTPNPDIFLEEFAKAISGWHIRVLDKVGDEIIRSSTFWPKPAEVNDKARALAEKEPQKKSYAFPSHRADYDEKTKESWRLAKEWREQCKAEYGSMEAYYAATRHMPRVNQFGKRQDRTSGSGAVSLASAARPAFEALQRSTPNAVHTSPKPQRRDGSLTEASKRMTGEHSE